MLVKGCPFCGKMPKIDTSQWKHFEHQYDPTEIVEQRVKIDCDYCFLHMDISARRTAQLGLDENAYRRLAKRCVEDVLSSIWNRRYWDGRDNAWRDFESGT